MKLTEILENISLVGRLDLIPSLTAKRHVLFNPFFLLATRVGRTAAEELSLIDLTCVWKAARGIRILDYGVALAELSTTSSAWAEWGDPLLANTVPSLVLLPRHFFFFLFEEQPSASTSYPCFCGFLLPHARKIIASRNRTEL